MAKLGDVRINWKPLSMSFMDQGRMIHIRGDPSLAKEDSQTPIFKERKGDCCSIDVLEN